MANEAGSPFDAIEAALTDVVAVLAGANVWR